MCLINRKDDEMYIPEFACGFIAGFIVGIITLIVICLAVDKRDKEEK